MTVQDTDSARHQSNMDSNPDSAAVDISVIVPTYNDAERVRQCAEALLQQECSYPYEILIVDNGSRVPPSLNDLGLSDLGLSDLGARVALLQESKPGSYAARNRAIDRSRGRVLAFTDSDCLPDRSWLQTAMAALESQPEVDMVSGKVAIYYKDPDHPTAVELYESLYAFRQDLLARSGQSVTANLFVRRELFHRLGKFNDETFSGGDFEFTKRATQAGYQLKYLPDAVVRHPARREYLEYRKKLKRTIGGVYRMREMDPHYEKPFAIQQLLKDALRPFKKTLGLVRSSTALDRTFTQVLVISGVIFHNEWYSLGLKLSYLLGLRKQYER
ncbi:MAG: glycosyltransferase family A protein [Pseudomonadota bacterium]|nr:glycosyltransferase family A protein [Pseudomonadota bacterium]